MVVGSRIHNKAAFNGYSSCQGFSWRELPVVRTAAPNQQLRVQVAHVTRQVHSCSNFVAVSFPDM